MEDTCTKQVAVGLPSDLHEALREAASAERRKPSALRVYCRNPKCRMKLKAPVENPKDAFCTRGCYRQFHRKRCVVCEHDMERRTEHQLVCGKRRCRNALQGGFNAGRYHAPSGDLATQEVPILRASKSASKYARSISLAADPSVSRVHLSWIRSRASGFSGWKSVN